METQKRFAPEVPNYIPGLGRGAVGFTTRSDIGPMRMAPDLPFGPAPAGYVSGVGRGAIALSKEAEGDVDRGDYSDTLFDKWGGFQGSLFANLDYDEEDEEADKIYSHIDNTMDGRRKVRRETRLKQEIEKLRKERPTIAQQFADLKRELAKVKRGIRNVIEF
jgi:pre-mRNA-processing factor 6